MASVELRGVAKTYPDGTRAVDGIDLLVADGEFMVLVGPSGCGKTTALRMLAGLEEASEGAILIGGQDVTDAEAGERDVAMVFQNYALYPHMTVRENMAFPLRLAGMARPERDRRIEAVARTLGLSPHLGRRPGRLSGGQRQRVAMGRALVREPQVFLMDEPLSNLDAKLRVQMRNEIALIQRQLGVTTVYVTHDQVEALTMGDRIAVMRGGRVQQAAEPQALYDRPSNLFVAAFIGSPAMNLVEGVVEEGPALRLGGQRLALSAGEAGAARPGRRVVAGVRPEALSLARGKGDARSLGARVRRRESVGSDLLVSAALHGVAPITPTIVELALVFEDRAEAEGLGTARQAMVTARLPPDAAACAGDDVALTVAPGRLHLFDADTGRSLATR